MIFTRRACARLMWAFTESGQITIRMSNGKTSMSEWKQESRIFASGMAPTSRLRLGWVLSASHLYSTGCPGAVYICRSLCHIIWRQPRSLLLTSIFYQRGPTSELQFRLEDRCAIDTVVTELIRLKHARPDLLSQSVVSLRSIPDWLLKGPEMKIPCDRYRLIWVGADGTVQLCYVTFRLGNLHEKRLSQMLFTPEHRQASRDAFGLNCSNCHCAYTSRVDTHAPSRLKYLTWIRPWRSPGCVQERTV